ncbi:hypothetical protein CK203_021078 [Vitis vinifera]|uniref:Reverse transcriptase Ty1/copia-type domain-containing protein n=1 Tax=Vitis vinifera TaxID=29760 RepID=A0A438JWK5_VITVI|nr:hypothetical protein CK203_021078 [Vitis vinifera]
MVSELKNGNLYKCYHPPAQRKFVSMDVSHAATKHGDVEKADNIQPAATTEADEAKATNARTIPNLSYTQPVINSRISYHQSYGDHTLFIKQLPKMKIIALIVYVDDIIVIRDDIEEMQNLKGKLEKEFKIKDLRNLRYVLGIEVVRSKMGIYDTQRK